MTTDTKFCHYHGCCRPLGGDYGYCSERHAEIDRAFIDGGMGGSDSPHERRYIRRALCKWDASQETE